jgi:hypothetical protein
MDASRIRAPAGACIKADSLRSRRRPTIGSAVGPERITTGARRRPIPSRGRANDARQLIEPSRDTVATDAAVTTATATAIDDSRAAMIATENRAQPKFGAKPDSLHSIRAGAIR